jgi:Tol biopolymer transport system component
LKEQNIGVFIPKSVVISFFTTLAACKLFAASGTLVLSVRDAQTGYAIRTAVQLEGPESVTLQTDEKGRVMRTLTAGEYRVLVSAPGYKPRKAHINIGSAGRLNFHLMLDSENPPEEERPEAINREIRPGLTYYHGYIVDDESGQPLSDVRVRFVNSGIETYTDSKGHFGLSVPTPKPSVPDGMGTDTLIYEKPGYKTVIFDNFGITGEAMGGLADGMEKGAGVIRNNTPHKLLQKPGANPEEPQSAKPDGASLSPELYQWLGSSGTSFTVGVETTSVATAQAITVPSSINLGTGGSSQNSYQACSGKYTCSNVFNYSLEGYVSNGLTSEWIGGWDSNALKAGAVAYRSYGAYYVANPVCPTIGAQNGQCTQVYDICNTTACQVYNPWGTNSKPTNGSKAAVSATAGVVLSKDGVNIFFAEYAAESNKASDTQYATCPDGQVGEPSYPGTPWPCMKDFICTGAQLPSTHSRGMCTYGSQRWATGKNPSGTIVTTPRDWQCILDHYYNDNSNSTGAGTQTRTAYSQGTTPYGQIVYSTGSDIYSMNSDGSSVKKIGQGRMPTWSPGGAKIAFLSFGIYSMNADGSGQTPVSGGTDSSSPNWSMSGNNKITFDTYQFAPNSPPQIAVINADGSGLVRLTSDGMEDREPAWSPDGSKVVFQGAGSLFLINADGSGEHQLTFGPDSGPNWSPQGTSIVFGHSGIFQNSWGCVVIDLINPDGSSQTDLTSCIANGMEDLSPSWLGTQKIVFVSNRENVSSNTTWDIYMVDISGANLTRLTRNSLSAVVGVNCSRCPRFDN